MTTSDPRAALEAQLCATAARLHRTANELIDLAHLLHRMPTHAPVIAQMLDTIMRQCEAYRETLGVETMGEGS